MFFVLYNITDFYYINFDFRNPLLEFNTNYINPTQKSFQIKVVKKLASEDMAMLY